MGSLVWLRAEGHVVHPVRVQDSNALDGCWRAGEEGNRIKDSKDQALARFAAGISDEFGDLLTSLGGNLSLLESTDFLNEDSRGTIKNAQQACERGREIINEIASIRGGRKAKSIRGADDATVRVSRTWGDTCA